MSLARVQLACPRTQRLDVLGDVPYRKSQVISLGTVIIELLLMSYIPDNHCHPWFFSSLVLVLAVLMALMVFWFLWQK